MADQAERAARLAKADLVTGMVGEFPELQGLMGGYYAAAQDEAPAVAEAIRDHYKPVGQGDEVPTAPVTVAVSLADKLDTMISFFSIDEKPSGSRDPFALRRAALGVIQLTAHNGLRLRINGAIREVVVALVRTTARLETRKDLKILWDAFYRNMADSEAARKQFLEILDHEKLGRSDIADHISIKSAIGVISFLADRLKVQQREAGVRHDLIDAVFALGGEDDLVRLLARVRALQSFVTTEDGANLLAGYKRAANILKKEEYVAPAKAGAAGLLGDDGSSNSAAPASAGATLSYTPEPAEADLIAALDAAGPAAADAVGNEDFEAAMAALATLRAPIDAFFDAVTVNDADPVKRAARLALLARVRDAVHGVADFSKIEG